MTTSTDTRQATYWVVLVLRMWSALEVLGTSLPDDLGPGQPCGWMPVYHTRDEAVAYADGDESRVFEVRAVLP